MGNALLLRYNTAAPIAAVQFPRFAVYMASGGQNYSYQQSTLISYLQHMDLVIIGGDYEGAAAGNGYNRNTLVNAINVGDGAATPRVMQYNTCDRIGANGDTSQGAPNSVATPIWYAQLTAMVGPWSVWANGSSGTHVSSGYAPSDVNIWLTNPCDLGARSKDANGNAMYAAFQKYTHDYYFAGATADAAPQMAGVFHDNFAIPYNGAPGPVGDYLQDGSPAAPTNVTIANAIFTGLAEAVTWWHTNAPGTLICGNSGWQSYLSDNGSLRIYQRPLSVIGALATTAKQDFQLLEGFMGVTFAIEYYAGLAACATYLAYNAATSNYPTLNMSCNEGLNASGECPGSTSSVGAGLRYFLGGAWVLDNGVPLYFSTRYVTNNYYATLDWPDWLAVDPVTGDCQSYASSTSAQLAQYRYWMGTAIDPVQTAPYVSGAISGLTYVGGPNLFVRRFLTPNGRIALVLVNESTNYHTGNTSAVVTLPSGGWQALTASATNYGTNSSVDNGASGLTTITVPTGDARILLH